MKVTKWSRGVLEKLIVTELVKRYQAFYGIRRSLTVFTDPTSSPYPEPDEYDLNLNG
jgi:hypothetical protein